MRKATDKILAAHGEYVTGLSDLTAGKKPSPFLGNRRELMFREKLHKGRSSRKLGNRTASIERHSQKLPYKLLLFISKPRLNYTPVLLNDYSIDRDRPVIFACNHSSTGDAPVAVTALRRHCYLLVGYQNLYFLDKLYFFLNGSFYVDRKGPENGRLVKQALAKHLQKGKALLWFPEGHGIFRRSCLC